MSGHRTLAVLREAVLVVEPGHTAKEHGEEAVGLIVHMSSEVTTRRRPYSARISRKIAASVATA
jgi:hypothetical protein